MIEKLGIRRETHGEVFCKMFEALIDEALSAEREWGRANTRTEDAIEEATGRSWQEVKEIIR